MYMPVMLLLVHNPNSVLPIILGQLCYNRYHNELFFYYQNWARLYKKNTSQSTNLPLVGSADKRHRAVVRTHIDELPERVAGSRMRSPHRRLLVHAVHSCSHEQTNEMTSGGAVRVSQLQAPQVSHTHTHNSGPRERPRMT